MRGLLTTFLLICLPLAAAGQTGALSFGDSPRLVVSFDHRGDVRVQQQIVLRLLILSGSPFERLDLTRPESTPDFDVLQVSAPQTRTVRTDAATGYVHEAAYALFPQRSGSIALPAVRARGQVRDAKGETVEFDIERPGSRLAVLAAPDTWTEPWWMVSERVEFEERWSFTPEKVRQGDVIRRTVTVTAHGVPADRIAAPAHPDMAGARVSDAGLELRTVVNADGVVGTLARSWDIAVGPALVLHLPPVRLVFWDAGKGEPSLRLAPSRRLEPAPPDTKARAAMLLATAEEERRSARLALWIVLAGLLVPGIGALAAFARVVLPSAADLRLAAACRRRGDPVAALRAIAVWGRETGLAPEESEAVRRFGAAVFGAAVSSAGEKGDPRAAAAALLRRARGARRTALFAALARLGDAVLGPAVDIPRGRREP